MCRECVTICNGQLSLTIISNHRMHFLLSLAFCRVRSSRIYFILLFLRTKLGHLLKTFHAADNAIILSLL